MKSLFLSITLVATTFTASASVNYADQYHTIKTIELKEVVEDGSFKVLSTVEVADELTSFVEKAADPRLATIGEVIKITKDLIALGEQIYKIVEAGKPVVNMSSAPISVLPKDQKGQAVEAFNLTKWKAPKVKKFIVEAKNYLGMTPVSFEFMVIFSYGGKYNGKGAFINGAQIIPTKADVAWGYELDAAFTVQQITNQGTSDAPIAAAVLSMKYNISTILKDSTENSLFFINGNGVATAL